MRAGHTEAGCDLTRMAGLTPAAVICEVMKDDGTMARLPDLLLFAKGGGVIYDPTTDHWTDLFPGEAPEHDDTSPVWTGSVALLLGSYEGSTGGAALTLPPK